MSKRHLAALGLLASMAAAQPSRPTLKAGAVYSITRDREMVQTSSDGSSSGSSTDVDTITERVLKVSDDGAEVEVDLPANADQPTRALVWQLPARVLLPSRGPARLLNAATLEARVDPWLKLGGWSRAQCGKPIFTWNYFIIECDPQSVVRMIGRFDPEPIELRDGLSYRPQGAQAIAQLRARPSRDGSTVLVAEARIDPDVLRRQRAEASVAVAALSGKTLSLDAAMQALRDEEFTGTIETTFELGTSGTLRRRVTVTTVTSRKASGVSKTETVTETLDRRCMAGCA